MIGSILCIGNTTIFCAPALAQATAQSSIQAAQTVSQNGLTVHYRAPNDRQELRTVFAAWATAKRNLAQMGVKVPAIRVEASLNAANFAALTREPAGIAASTVGKIIYTQRLGALAGRGLLLYTIRHEVFHIVQPAGLSRWQAEGLARIFSGEIRTDPVGHTGFEQLTGPQLDEQLLNREPAALGRAYAEATARVQKLIGRVGWQGFWSGQR